MRQTSGRPEQVPPPSAGRILLDGRFAMTHLDIAGIRDNGGVYRAGGASGQGKLGDDEGRWGRGARLAAVPPWPALAAEPDLLNLHCNEVRGQLRGGEFRALIRLLRLGADGGEQRAVSSARWLEAGAMYVSQTASTLPASMIAIGQLQPRSPGSPVSLSSIPRFSLTAALKRVHFSLYFCSGRKRELTSGRMLLYSPHECE